MKIVLDSNILLVAIGKRSKYRPIWEAFLDGKFKLILSDEILYEYQEILEQYSAPGAAALVIEIFMESPDIIFQHISYNWNIISDPDDNKFYDVAVAANADCIVTNDAHFNGVKLLPFPVMNIVNADEFLQQIQSL